MKIVWNVLKEDECRKASLDQISPYALQKLIFGEWQIIDDRLAQHFEFEPISVNPREAQTEFSKTSNNDHETK